MTAELLVDATVQLRVGGEPVGSGFWLHRDDIVVTNAHVLHRVPDSVPITAVMEPGSGCDLELVDTAPPRSDGHDFAILHAADELPSDHVTLEPASLPPTVGDKILFAGHPFDIPDTLVHDATVSGPFEHGFYLDGSVNYRNSGGPIVDKRTGNVLGIITESREYRSEELDESIDDLVAIRQQLLRIQEAHQTTINHVSVDDLAIDTIMALEDGIGILARNISSGIGVGYSIDHVVSRLNELEFA